MAILVKLLSVLAILGLSAPTFAAETTTYMMRRGGS